MRNKVSTDAELADLAASQYGVVAARQLDLSRAALTRRVQAGRLHPVHRGVYLVGHAAPRREARWLAAVLAVGDDAVLSHRSAASLWRIREGEGPHPDVTAPHDSRHPAIATHRSNLTDPDRRERFGIAVTSPARTLVDLAHCLPVDELFRAVREAQYLKLYDRAAIQATLRRRPSKALASTLPALVTQSEMEQRFLAICTRYRLTAPERQYRIDAKRYDFAWPEHHVVVETDGWKAHAGPIPFQADRTQSNALQLTGWLVLRFTWEDLTQRARTVATTVRAALHG